MYPCCERLLPLLLYWQQVCATTPSVRFVTLGLVIPIGGSLTGTAPGAQGWPLLFQVRGLFWSHEICLFSCLRSHKPFILIGLMAGTTGLEPATSAVTGQRSNQLSYVPAMLPSGLRSNPRQYWRLQVLHTAHVLYGAHGMVAFSAGTAHKPPVRNRVLVTSQSIAKNGYAGLSQTLILDPLPQ
jgi:hypothetical protein